MPLRKPFSYLAIGVALLSQSGHARILDVGPGKAYPMPSDAAAVAKDGDTVRLAPVLYSGDVTTWTANNLHILSTGLYAHLDAAGQNESGKGTWVIKGANCSIYGVEFSGSTVPDENGAGIRQEGPNLTLSHCYFHDNEDGILTDGGTSDIVIEYSEFSNNGFGDGQSHNMYIGDVSSFTLRYCYTHNAKIGHNIKSRAVKNFILYNNSSNGTDGTDSYELDLPNGGLSYVIGNVFQQSAHTDNPTMLAYGEESIKHPGTETYAMELYVINNTFVNDYPGGGTFLDIFAGTKAKVRNNLFVGGGKLVDGSADTAANVVTNAPAFLSKASGDYRLAAGSPAIDKGTDPGSAGSYSLYPTLQYVHPANVAARVVKGALDAGAFEYAEGTAIKPPRPATPKHGSNGPGPQPDASPWRFRIGWADDPGLLWNALGKIGD